MRVYVKYPKQEIADEPLDHTKLYPPIIIPRCGVTLTGPEFEQIVDMALVHLKNGRMFGETEYPPFYFEFCSDAISIDQGVV